MNCEVHKSLYPLPFPLEQKMLKLIRSRWNHCNTTLRVLHSFSTPTDTLFHRISRAGDPIIPMTPILNQWIQEGSMIQCFHLILLCCFFFLQIKLVNEMIMLHSIIWLCYYNGTEQNSHSIT